MRVLKLKYLKFLKHDATRTEPNIYTDNKS